ncbi:MAG: protein kinase [Polyangiales bacterium]
MPEPEPQPHDPLIGASLDGRYTIRELLGRGGMGVVYAGVHDQLHRAVAIKVLNAAWASDPVAVERFLREARTASSFTHGNIVPVTDLGRLPDGRPYLVMPKVEGTDLAALLELAGPQPPRRVAELLGGVASALDLIHARGLVHRDIKPENLMYVVREDGSETVMLLDFGIAALVMSNQSRLTTQGAVFGTPAYLPPEVCDGRLPDGRGDVYALATVAFELMTGKLPFDAPNPFQILPQKLARDAPTLERKSGVTYPPEIEAVIARGLARDPKDRYSSGSELIGALSAVTVRAPVSWRPGELRASAGGEPVMGPSTLEFVNTTMGLQPPARAPTDSASLIAGSYTLEEASGTSVDPASEPTFPTQLDAPGVAGSRMRGRLVYAGLSALLLFAALAWAMHGSEPVSVVAPAKPPAPPVVPPPAPAPPQTFVAPRDPIPAPVPMLVAKPVEPRPERPGATLLAAAPPARVSRAPHSASAPIAPHAAVRSPSAAPEARLVVKASTAPPSSTAPAPPTADRPARDPAQAAQLTREGTAALLGGQVPHAIALLRQATQADPSHAPAWRSLGLALERQGQAKEAVAAYRQALRIEPQGAQAAKVRERIAALQ